MEWESLDVKRSKINDVHVRTSHPTDVTDPSQILGMRGKKRGRRMST